MNVDLNQKQLTHIILALEAYARLLEQDEENPGPSMADAMYAANLAKMLREKRDAADRNSSPAGDLSDVQQSGARDDDP